jgi:hypothetical protein
MRRVFNIGFFVCVIACAVVLYARLGQRKPTAVADKPAATTPPAAPGPPPRLSSPPVLRDAGHDLAGTTLDERALLRQIRALVKSQPERAEALAREARRRFPDGAEADERDALLVDALINQQRIGAARDETYYYFDHHPSGRFSEHLFVMTGVHPTR